MASLGSYSPVWGPERAYLREKEKEFNALSVKKNQTEDQKKWVWQANVKT